MTRLLTTTAFVLVSAYALPAYAVDSPVTASSACAQSWTIVDSDESGTISDAEAQAATEAGFARIDVNDDGIVSVTEWKDCGDPAAYPGEPAPGNTPAALDASTDTDADVEGMTVSPASDQAAADLTIPVPENVDSQVAEIIDEPVGPGDVAAETASADEPATTGTIGEGTISSRSQDFVAPFNRPDFTSLDADQSGDLSVDEAIEASRSHYDPASGTEEDAARRGAGMFSRLDADADGRLTAEEWSARGQTTAEAGFGRIDGDGNGEVSQDEWNQFRRDRLTSAMQSGAGEEPTTWLYYFYVL